VRDAFVFLGGRLHLTICLRNLNQRIMSFYNNTFFRLGWINLMKKEEVFSKKVAICFMCDKKKYYRLSGKGHLTER